VADTGLPWELPYPLPTDLVRDGADAIKDLAEATATGLSAAGNEGIGSNVVTATKVDTQSTTSTSYADVSGLSVTITPSSATSKVLVIATVMVGTSTAFTPMLTLADGSDNNLIVPTSPGSRLGAFYMWYANAGTNMKPAAFSLLHSPNTALAFTYKVRFRTANAGNAAFINRSSTDTDNNEYARGVSTITAIEVSA
jgi:hypothetical protein